LNLYKQHKRIEDRPISNEDLLIPFEKWLVALSKMDLSKGNLILREFYAQGYFEAYDIVMTYAEKTNSEVVWFKEKRNCGYPESNTNFLGLEHFCTYCNRKFSNREPIPCLKENCLSHFCSDKCFQDHIHLRKHHQ
jgi:hypothetical protein